MQLKSFDDFFLSLADVLYPGVNSKNVKEVIENHHPDEMPYNLVLIDGTWYFSLNDFDGHV